MVSVGEYRDPFKIRYTIDIIESAAVMGTTESTAVRH